MVSNVRKTLKRLNYIQRELHLVVARCSFWMRCHKFCFEVGFSVHRESFLKRRLAEIFTGFTAIDRPNGNSYVPSMVGDELCGMASVGLLKSRKSGLFCSTCYATPNSGMKTSLQGVWRDPNHNDILLVVRLDNQRA